MLSILFEKIINCSKLDTSIFYFIRQIFCANLVQSEMLLSKKKLPRTIWRASTDIKNCDRSRDDDDLIAAGSEPHNARLHNTRNYRGSNQKGNVSFRGNSM